MSATKQPLRVRGKNKAARIALAGSAHSDGDVVIPQPVIASATLTAANRVMNGRLVVNTVDGRSYQLHFRRKQQGDFERLALEMDA